ncbi:MAG: arginine N-succinyltransferase, partial [Candidatus Thiodiazotropha endolucinida]|nr:arginine N-succinyltransferase [Candidatus Thiodiazotropha taylori]MCW4312093.1 arginine N-succinyltransferase [Candidatus Thiodiazotropha taylori]
WLRAERYSEKNARREVFFTERELNGMVANNQEMAKKLAIDLSDDLVSARILVPVDPDFPILGGKTLRVSTGMELAFRDARPVVILKGVSIMGVPIPNAWLGGLKNIDLVSEFGDEQGFWAGFAEGVDNIRVVEGELKIKLKE